MCKKGTKLYSILFNKCPKCHEGDFLKENSILKIHKVFDMHENCTICGLKYMMEPSFYYGAMYVNYSLSVGLSIITFAIATLIFSLSLTESFIPIVIVLLSTAPLSTRFSRIIWINFFVKYNADTKKFVKND